MGRRILGPTSSRLTRLPSHPQAGTDAVGPSPQRGETDEGSGDRGGSPGDEVAYPTGRITSNGRANHPGVI